MKAILTGMIGSLANSMLITLSAQNTGDGDEIASEQATAPTRRNVLSALGTAAARCGRSWRGPGKHQES